MIFVLRLPYDTICIYIKKRRNKDIKNKEFNFRVNDTDLSIIKRNAHLLNMSAGEYIRGCALNKKIDGISYPDAAETVLAELKIQREESEQPAFTCWIED